MTTPAFYSIIKKRQGFRNFRVVFGFTGASRVDSLPGATP
nr:MAG TPA: hypothetical protein [Caudoviricetes sp.]